MNMLKFRPHQPTTEGMLVDPRLDEFGARKKDLRWYLGQLNNQKLLLMMSLPFVVHIIIFRYVPIYGWIMAFQDYTPGQPIIGQELVGFKHFIRLFEDVAFWYVVRNTLAMSVIMLTLGTVFALLVAVMINETRNRPFKRTVQVISYLPHFVSWVVAANLVLDFLSPTGILNTILVNFGILESPELFMGKPELFWWVIGWSHVWKTAGFGAIIYLAAMTAIDPQLYEAANMDGAGRLRQIWSITLPSIKPTVIILLILNIGNLMNAGFEQQYLLQNSLVRDYSEVFEIYILRYGFELYRYSYAAAAGIFKSVTSIIILVIANWVAGRMGEETLM